MLYVCYVFEDFKHMLNVGRNLDKLVINERVSRFSKKRVYSIEPAPRPWSNRIHVSCVHNFNVSGLKTLTKLKCY